MYDLYNKVIRAWNEEESEQLRKHRAIDDPNQIIKYTDPRYLEDITTTVGRLASRVASTHKFSYFLYKLINYMKYDRVLEAGTSLGINASYLGNSKASRVWTMEGIEEIAATFL